MKVRTIKIAAWNVNHRGKARAIRPDLASAIGTLGADIVFLSEYIAGDDAPRHQSVCEQLQRHGYYSFHLTDQGPLRENQVLVAAKEPIEIVALDGPAIDWARPGIAAARIDDLEIVGLRIPWYKRDADERAYWDWLVEFARERCDTRSVVIGDMNEDLLAPRRRHTAIDAIRALGWHIPAPDGQWSFAKAGGLPRSRIDHLIAARAVQALKARYVVEFAGLSFAGAASSVSDHAAFVAEIV